VQALLSKLSDAVSQLDGDEGDAEDEFGEGAGEEEEEEEEEDLEDDTAFTAEFGDVGGNPVVSEYEALIQNQLVPFLAAATEIGGEVQKQAAYVAQAFGAQHAMLVEVRTTHPLEQCRSSPVPRALVATVGLMERPDL
jgi:hypothetical protein